MPPTETLPVLQRRHGAIGALRHHEATGTLAVMSGVLHLHGDQTLYAIPKPILRVLEAGLDVQLGKQPWFTAQELEVEQWFTDHCNALTCLGFSCRGPIVFPLLARAQPSFKPVNKENIHDLLEWVRAKFRVNVKMDIDAVVRMQQVGNNVVQMMKEQQLGYQGWLQTYVPYQEEKEALKKEWIQAGANPHYLFGRNLLSRFSTLSAQEQFCLGIDHSLANTFLAFYRRWDLESFASWDLPIQLQPNLGGSGQIGLLMELDLNPAIQLPVTMKLPSKLPVQNYLETRSQDHLQPWRDILKKNQTKRLAEGFVIHFYQEEILRPILGDALYRCQRILNEVLTEAFKQDAPLSSMRNMSAETVKKVQHPYRRRRLLTKPISQSI
ncbi:MAG: hypothetical protein U0796_00085 [Gemmatales bacterium]